MAVLTVERPPLRLLPWLHACHPFAAKTNPKFPPEEPLINPPLGLDQVGCAR